MKLISVNVGEKRTLQKGDKWVTTGIFKFPASGRVRIGELGLEGDVIMDAKHHGGPDQAVYVYGEADYAWWREQLGRDLPPGIFGENLTISELESASFNVGDVLLVGEVKLQVTAPRIPCSDFAARMDDLQWVKKFRAAERPGLYCRVLQEGFVQAGDSVTVEKYEGETLSLVQMYRDHYQSEKDKALLQRHLAAPVSIRTRRKMEDELQKHFDPK
ncbi:MAG: MOSC domain-containing protein [Anaerolineaceae bacterium]|nr:MAG: MOSC domain-containing protein [Anaerolineaceae bacterium]